MVSNYERVKKCIAKNCVQTGITLNKNTDADVIDMLASQPNKRAYILGLIREDIRRKQA